jgi:lipid II:glycine glycyltransferase (peptidoglycan interpeptide bridge formation enzyme)
MAKKEGRKRKKASTKKTTKTESSRDVEKLNSILVENFVSLQKAMTNLATKFDSLSDQISKLLQLFEISAKSFAEKLATGTPDIEKDREFLDKLNKLLEQNKVIAKGLTLMEEKIRERVYGEHVTPRPQGPTPPPQTPVYPPTTSAREGYLPSSIEERRTRPTEEK